MLEKIRILISQLIASALVVFLAVRMGINIINNTGLKYRLGNLGFNYESIESVALGLALAYFSVLMMILVVWLIRWPKTNYTKKRRKTAKKIDMGKVKNIPERVR